MITAFIICFTVLAVMAMMIGGILLESGKVQIHLGRRPAHIKAQYAAEEAAARARTALYRELEHRAQMIQLGDGTNFQESFREIRELLDANPAQSSQKPPSKAAKTRYEVLD